MYNPPESIGINPYPHFRLGLQGAPNTGKTWSALSFPNPLVANFDNKLGAHIHRKDVKQIPFWDVNFIATLVNKPAPGKYINRRDAFKFWLRDNGHKLDTDQTFIIDSWTMLCNAVHQEFTQNHPRDKKGELCTYTYWRMVKQYCADICECLKGLSCSVVVTCHETVERNDEGQLTGKMKPLMTGSFADEMAGHFTDWFRAVVDPKENTSSVKYFWQTSGDRLFDGGSSVPGIPKLIPANYQTLLSEWKNYQNQNKNLALAS